MLCHTCLCTLTGQVIPMSLLLVIGVTKTYTGHALSTVKPRLLECQGPPDFLQIIGSSNFRNLYFSEMFGSFRSVLIFDCISIKNGEPGIISYL